MSVVSTNSRSSFISGVDGSVVDGGMIISKALKFLSIATSLGVVVTSAQLSTYLLNFYGFNDVGKAFIENFINALQNGSGATINLTGAGVNFCLSSIVNLATVINIATLSAASVGMATVKPALTFGAPFTLGVAATITPEQKEKIFNEMIKYTEGVKTSIATTSNIVGEQISSFQQGMSNTVQLAKDTSEQFMQSGLNFIQNLKNNITNLSNKCDHLGINIYGRFFLDDGTITSTTISAKSIQSIIDELNDISQESKIKPPPPPPPIPSVSRNMNVFNLGEKRTRDDDTVSTNIKRFKDIGEEIDYCFSNSVLSNAPVNTVETFADNALEVICPDINDQNVMTGQEIENYGIEEPSQLGDSQPLIDPSFYPGNGGNVRKTKRFKKSKKSKKSNKTKKSKKSNKSKKIKKSNKPKRYEKSKRTKK